MRLDSWLSKKAKLISCAFVSLLKLSSVDLLISGLRFMLPPKPYSSELRGDLNEDPFVKPILHSLERFHIPSIFQDKLSL